MKDHRFIELVNLYIDRQISPAEAAELESELQSNARRRQVYQQYCRMHRATQLVYESFRQEAGREAPNTAAHGGTLVRLEGARQRRARWASALGGVAAAACVGLFVSRAFFAPDAGVASLPERPTADATIAAAPSVPARVPVELAPRPVANLVSLSSPLSLETDYQAMLAALRLQDAATGLTAGSTPRSLFEDAVFTAPPLLPDQNARTFQNRRGVANQATTEFTAFQFQR